MAVEDLGITLAEPTEVDKMLEEKREELKKLFFKKKESMEVAEKLLQSLRDFDANLGDFGEDLPPVIVVRLSRKAIVYIVVFEDRHILTAVEALKIVEGLLPYLAKLRDSGFKPVILFYSKKGKLTLTAYLYLGNVIDRHQVGILFVNGDFDEIIEILWHLDNVGKYEVQEEDYLDLARLR